MRAPTTAMCLGTTSAPVVIRPNPQGRLTSLALLPVHASLLGLFVLNENVPDGFSKVGCQEHECALREKLYFAGEPGLAVIASIDLRPFADYCPLKSAVMYRRSNDRPNELSVSHSRLVVMSDAAPAKTSPSARPTSSR